MGRFEKRSENPRTRGDLPRAAENALWDVVEDLENLQQNLLKSLQEDIKRLEAEKNRLANDIQKLIDEKEQLQQARQITEQQVLIRQLAEVLAKHISSQLQSSLKTLASQSVEKSSTTPVQPSSEVNTGGVQQINQNVSQMLDNLDDTVTIAFNSLLQELKNYQSNISQQLSRMYDQQQQGEAIFAEFVNRLREGLEQNQAKVPAKVPTGGIPTVLQTAEPYKNGFAEKSAQKIVSEPVALITPEPKTETLPTSTTFTFLQPPEKINPANTDEQPEESSQKFTPELPPSEKSPESAEVNNSDPPAPPPPETTPTTNIVSEPDYWSGQPSRLETSATENSTDESEPSEVENNSLTNTVSEPDYWSGQPSRLITSSQEKPSEPISVFSPQSNDSEVEGPTTVKSQFPPQKTHRRSRGTSSLSPVQVGLFLVILSTVVSALYNVAIKAIFQTGSQLANQLEISQLILPTLGNVFLILMLRLLVVVPLMLLLAPILHPQVWQDLQNLFNAVREQKSPSSEKTKRVLLLSVVSGGVLFLSQVLIYLSLGEVSMTTGMAIALFFIYPIFSVFLSWVLFRERLKALGMGAIAAIICGELLVLSGTPAGLANNSFGTTTAIISGITFAVYIILTKICSSQLHPVSFTLINFATMLLLSFACLIIPLPSDWSLIINSSNVLELVLSAFMLGVLTLCGYLLNNFGISKLGAPRSAIIGTAVPILTVIFAGLIIQESLNFIQVLGILFVTTGRITPTK
jgi:drug/metabolite transporter (DMT)-like permease/uncharacterized protein (UPF0335 family)